MQYFRLRGRKHLFLLSLFEHFGGRETKKIQVPVILSQNVIIYALKRLSDWMVAWRFRKSSRKHQIWSGKRSSCEFSEWNSEKSPMALFPLGN